MTTVWFVGVFVILVLYTQSHEDGCQLHPCVCDFSVIHTEPWGRLSASSLLAFCFNSVCTAAWAKFTQVTSVSPIANNNNNNKTSNILRSYLENGGKGTKKQFTTVKVVAMPFSLVLWTYHIRGRERNENWRLATLLLTDELSQSASTYKHASLNTPAGCQCTIVA